MKDLRLVALRIGFRVTKPRPNAYAMYEAMALRLHASPAASCAVELSGCSRRNKTTSSDFMSRLRLGVGYQHLQQVVVIATATICEHRVNFLARPALFSRSTPKCAHE